MDFAQVFLGFLQPVALGSAAVLILLYIVRLKAPRRSPALIFRKPSR